MTMNWPVNYLTNGINTLTLLTIMLCKEQKQVAVPVASTDRIKETVDMLLILHLYL